MNKALIFKIKTLWFKHIRAQDDKAFYRLLGLRRSGNHALQNWLLGQMEGRIAILDNMQKNAPERVPHKKIRINGLRKSTLIVSHEDRPLEDFFLTYSEDQFGTSANIYTLLILRDPYNWLASWYAWQDELGLRFREDREFRHHTIGLWKEYARLFIKWSDQLDSGDGINRVALNYNRWTSDQNYRKELAERLGLTFSDKGREKVSINGYGSSFSGTGYDGKASQLKVLERWKTFKDDEIYRSYLDLELKELASEIFPDLKIPDGLFM